MNFFYKIASAAETLLGKIQGKGFGSYSISFEVKTCLNLLHDSPLLCLDIGGNVGDYSTEILKKFPSTEIHIFEPSPKNIKILKKKFLGKENIHLLPFAISNFTGKARLFYDKKGSPLASLSLRKLEHFNIKNNQSEKIDVICIFDYWKKNLGKRVIDLIKMDIEGLEYNALIGFKSAIKKTKLVQFEFGGCNIDSKTYFRDFWFFLTNNNFVIYRITPFGAQLLSSYNESDETFITTNFIGINKIFVSNENQK
jgi:FkbM family methyltransferase